MLNHKDAVVVCDRCGRGVDLFGAGLGDLVRGLRDEGWLLGSVDLCPDHQSLALDPPICDVQWCSRPEQGHIEHRAGMKVVQGDVAAGMDAPEHEGVPVSVGLVSEDRDPRLGLGVIGMQHTLTVKLTAEATAYVRELLESSIDR